jgi:TolA-binding protein
MAMSAHTPRSRTGRPLASTALRFLALSGLLSLGGCFAFTTRHEGDLLRKDAAALRARVDELTGRVPEIIAATARSESQVKQLQDVLDRTDRLLRSSSADVLADVQKIREDLNSLLGQVEEFRVGLTKLDKAMTEYRAKNDVKLEQMQTTSPTAAAPVPTDKEQLWSEAERKLSAGQYDEARRLYRSFTDKFPSDARVDNARYKLGDSYFLEKKFAAAIGEFTKLIDAAKKGDDAVDDAMFRSGEAFAELRYFCDARVYFQQLPVRFPESPFVKEARSLAKDMALKAKNAKQKCEG